MSLSGLAKGLVLLGGLLILAGGLLWGFGKLGLGRLPGDFEWAGRNWRVSFPLATSILLSLLLTLLLNLIAWFFRSR